MAFMRMRVTRQRVFVVMNLLTRAMYRLRVILGGLELSTTRLNPTRFRRHGMNLPLLFWHGQIAYIPKCAGVTRIN
jgi:hypothetical protein